MAYGLKAGKLFLRRVTGSGISATVAVRCYEEADVDMLCSSGECYKGDTINTKAVQGFNAVLTLQQLFTLPNSYCLQVACQVRLSRVTWQPVALLQPVCGEIITWQYLNWQEWQPRCAVMCFLSYCFCSYCISLEQKA